MPNTRSAAKRLRQTKGRNERNRSAKSRLRSSIKKVRQALDAGNRDAAMAAFRAAVAIIDKTASKGVIHSRTAARYKSRLAHDVHTRGSAA
ncbi:MAG: 30S ribosomal protein S20 [Candidatus Methylomirabilales bacterium]